MYFEKYYRYYDGKNIRDFEISFFGGNGGWGSGGDPSLSVLSNLGLWSRSDACAVLLGTGRKILFNVSTITFPGVIYSGMLMCLESTGPCGLLTRVLWVFLYQAFDQVLLRLVFGAPVICLANKNWCHRTLLMTPQSESKDWATVKQGGGGISTFCACAKSLHILHKQSTYLCLCCASN